MQGQLHIGDDQVEMVRRGVAVRTDNPIYEDTRQKV